MLVTTKRGLARAQPRQPLGLADHPAGPAPGRQRAVAAFPEPPRGPAGGGAPAPGLVQRLREPTVPGGRCARARTRTLRPRVLAPAQDVLAAETRRRRAPPDPGPGPAPADLRHDPRQFVHRARRRIDIGRPQPGAQHMLAAGHVQREIAVVPVIGRGRTRPSWRPCSGSSVASRSSTISAGGVAWASRNRSTSNRSIASGSATIRW